MADVRRRIAAELRRAGGEEPGGLLAALVLGQAMVPLPDALREAFRAAGLSHALAASGFHLSVLLGAVLLLTRRAPALIRWPAAFGAMGLFGLLAGAQASVVRALLMGALAFVLKERGRRSRPLALLLICLLLMLLLRPSWLLDVGFQLSAAATGGLILSAGPLEERLQRWLPRWAAAAMAVPLAASLWTLPLQLLHFGVVPSYAVLSNVLAAPLLTPLTLGAMAMALTAVLMPPLLGLLAAVLVPLAQLLLALVAFMARLPLAQLPIGQLGLLLVVLLLAGLLPWLLPAGRRWRLLALPLLALAVGLRCWQQSRDQLLLVRQAPRQWLVLRHQGRAALVSLKADPSSCGRAAQLAKGWGWLALIGCCCWIRCPRSPTPAGQAWLIRRLIASCRASSCRVRGWPSVASAPIAEAWRCGPGGSVGGCCPIGRPGGVGCGRAAAATRSGWGLFPAPERSRSCAGAEPGGPLPVPPADGTRAELAA